MADKDLTKTQVKRGHPSRPAKEKQKQKQQKTEENGDDDEDADGPISGKYNSKRLKKNLDPLNPRKWKNEGGTKLRSDINSLDRERKQDLLIMIDTLCNKGTASDAFNKLTRQVQTTRAYGGRGRIAFPNR